MTAEVIELGSRVNTIQVSETANLKLTVRSDKKVGQPTILIPGLLDVDDNHVQTPRPRILDKTKGNGLLVVRTSFPEGFSTWQGGVPDRDPTPDRPAECTILLPEGQPLGLLALTGVNTRLALENLTIGSLVVDRRTAAEEGRSVAGLATLAMTEVILESASYIHMTGPSILTLAGVNTTDGEQGELFISMHGGKMNTEYADDNSAPLHFNQFPEDRCAELCEPVLSEGGLLVVRSAI
jgi:hypothetical protein